MKPTVEVVSQLLTVLIQDPVRREHIAKFLVIAIRNDLIPNVKWEEGANNET
jgi:hypothetical protein